MRLLKSISILILTTFLFVKFTSSVSAAAYFVAPTGTPEGTGTVEQPWDLATAFSKSNVIQPGDIVWLRGGTYGTGGSTVFMTKLKGTKEHPIIIRQYPGERAIVDGGIIARAPSAHNWFWGFEVTNSSLERKVTPTNRPNGFDLIGGQGHSVINAVIYNAGHPGVGFWSPLGDGATLYGNVLWGNGMYDISTPPGTPDKPWIRGNPFYMQNKEGTRYVEENITFRNFTGGMKAYTEGGYADGFRMVGNIIFNAPDWNFLGTGKTNPQKRMVFNENMLYRPITSTIRSLRFGYNSDQGDIVVENNYIAHGKQDEGALFIRKYKDGVIVRNNTFISGNILAQFRSPFPENPIWDNNTYYTNVAPRFQLVDSKLTVEQWREAGYDQNSEIIDHLPTENKVFVRPNKFQGGRANIAVYNWEKKTEQAIDFSTVLNQGDQYEIRDAQNYFTVIKSGTYDGAPITLPLNLTEVAPITGTITHFVNEHTSSEFNAFVVSVPKRELENPSGQFTFEDPRPQVAPTEPEDNQEENQAAPVFPVEQCAEEDINQDKIIDLSDYTILVKDFAKPAPEAENTLSDINKDGTVNDGDLTLLTAKFLKSCE